MNNGKTNNNFSIIFNQKISLKGDAFDAINLPKILNSKSKNNLLSNVNKEYRN